MDSKNAAGLAGLAVALVVVALLIWTLAPGPSATTTSTVSSTTASKGGLELRLSANASSVGPGAFAFQITATEHNTLASVNNVTAAREWRVAGLSLGACGTEAYPFGVALYRGYQTADGIASAQRIIIYPVVACPLMIRLVTGYLFQPTSHMAVILPSGPNATATPMTASVTAKSEYAAGHIPSTSAPLGPGTYTVAAGDEWGSLVLVHVTVGGAASSTSTGKSGTLAANFSIGPTAPVCMANATVGPAPPPYSSLDAVVTSTQSGQNTTLPLSWLSNGCSAWSSLSASLPPGTYSLNLSSCQFMGCARSLPRSFTVQAGQTTSVSVSVDTGIR